MKNGVVYANARKTNDASFAWRAFREWLRMNQLIFIM